MKGNQFDDMIRQSVNDWRYEGQPDWGSFKSRLDRAQQEWSDQKFDNQVKGNLQNYSAVPPSGSWDLLQERMEAITNRQKKVVAIKSLELIVLLLLLIPAMDYAVDASESDRSVVPNVVAESFQRTVPDQVTEDISLQTTGANATQPTTRGTILDEVTERNNADQTSRAQNQSVGDTASVNVLGLSKSDVTSVHRGSMLLEKDINQLADSDDELHVAQPANSITGAAFIKEKPLRNIGFFPQYVDTKPRDHAIGDLELTGSQEVNITDSEHYIHFTAGIQNNIISSPVDPVYEIAAVESYAPGYNAALLYSMRQKKSEWVAGFMYKHVGYTPYPITETYESRLGINIVSLEHISYDVLSIPIDYRYHFIQDKEWSLYGLIGVRPQILWHADYRISDELDIPLPKPPGSEPEIEEALLYQKSFDTGLANEGSFKDAFFISAAVGGGVERKISQKIHFYFNSYYSRQLSNTLGPNEDKIHVVGFMTGIKLRI